MLQWQGMRYKFLLKAAVGKPGGNKASNIFDGIQGYFPGNCETAPFRLALNGPKFFS